MERIVFKLNDYYDICDEYEEILSEYHESAWTEAQEGNVYGVYQYRIVIPKLHISLREGDWYFVDEEAADDEEDDDGDGGYQCGVFLSYSEDEKDINEYRWAVGPWFGDAIRKACMDTDFPFDESKDLECYIDFDD